MPEHYDSFVYPVWGTWGYKQEEHILTDEITRLNEIYKSDPLIVFWPEEELSFTGEDDTHLVLNKRDRTVQKVIIDVMDNTDKKGLIFYGSAHGLKNPTVDIWPLYWTAYFKTDKAIVSDKKSDYKSALIAWEKLFENDLFYASPVIKLAYEKASLCEEKSAESDFYKNKAESVNPLLDIDFEWYGYFGF